MRVKQALPLLGLFILAVNAKEMALTLPLLLLVYEWLHRTPAKGSRAEYARWLSRDGRTALVCLLLAMFALWGKTRAGGALADQPAYAMVFTVKRFFQNARSLYSDLFYLHEQALSTRQVLAIWVCLFLFAALRRNKTLWFCAWFVVLAPLPIMFIPYRGFFVMYFPLVAWATYLAVALVESRNWLLTRLTDISGRVILNHVGATVLAVIALLCVLSGTRDAKFRSIAADPFTPIIEATKKDFLQLNEPLPARGSVLLLRARFPEDAWGPLMIAHLLYDDRDLWLDRPTMMG